MIKAKELKKQIENWCLQKGIARPAIAIASAKNGDLRQLQKQIDFGVSVNLHDEEERKSLLLWTIEGKHTLCSLFLLRHPAIDHLRPDAFRWGNALYWCCAVGHLSLLRHLLVFYPQFLSSLNARDEYGYTPLHIAVDNNHFETVQFLLEEQNVDVNVPTYLHLHTPLHTATDANSFEMICLLLKHRADLSSRDVCGRTALHYSIRHGQKKIIQVLLDRKTASMKTDCGWSPFMLAVLQNRPDVTSLILSKCWDQKNTVINEVISVDPSQSCFEFKDSYVIGDTALHCAARRGYLGLVNWLIDRGANVDIVNVKGQSFLALIPHQCHAGIVFDTFKRVIDKKLYDLEKRILHINMP